MTTTTDQHKHTFALRDYLATVLQEEVDGDARASLIVNDADDEQFYRDLSESLIARGWVLDYPDDGTAE